MPKMDGFMATTKIRSLALAKRPMIFAMTAGALKGYREKCLKAGMDGYLAKPIAIKDLKELIKAYFCN
ncbi:MAG: response regulator [Lentisphaerae bacterium]|nr:response regulator [Lentisphaerota bacterium]MCP4102458.1 response regulator [Lentisphaerota bacterium]